jgi:hypothetical protein
MTQAFVSACRAIGRDPGRGLRRLLDNVAALLGAGAATLT